MQKRMKIVNVNMDTIYTLIYMDYQAGVYYLCRRRSNFELFKICRSRIVIVYKRNHWYIVVFVPSPCFERRIDHILALFPSIPSFTNKHKRD